MNEEQQRVFDIVTKEFKSVCICGSGGVGKSYLVKHIVNDMTQNNRDIAVVATTGTAAVNVGGRTVHSLFNLTPFIKNYEMHADFIKYKRLDIVKRLRRLKTLIIDEVSMLDNVLCDGISTILSVVRNNVEPFGGVQMVFVGDFFQLPPVSNDFCFKSLSWEMLEPKICELKTIVRQKGDEEFIKILQRIRVGKFTKKMMQKLVSLQDTEFPEDVKPTILYSTNVDVDSINKRELDKLRDGTRVFCVYSARYLKTKGRDKRLELLDIELCEGAQVMVTRNIDIENEIVNGTRGVVVRVNKSDVLIRTVDGKEVSVEYITEDIIVGTQGTDGTDGTHGTHDKKEQIVYMPLRLAYALTIHKAQGATLDCMEISLDSKVFNYGQAYTGLSRAKNMKSVKIKNLCMSAFRTSPDVLEYMSKVI